VLVDAHRQPVIDYDLIQSAFDHAHALCDVSDGLIADASHMAKASQVQINITTEALAIADPLRDMGLALTENPMNWILTGGDDHAFLGAFDDANVPTGWTVVGQVVTGSGVTVDGSAFIGPAGHTHFAQ
jgi:thiamine-monophosphate kinase